ncbi:hypothetical protein TNCV_1248271 [Trichonephila clavipes]|nr:hypothetical protein TNCV_1248271 [Trichonephila clavipes]
MATQLKVISSLQEILLKSFRCLYSVENFTCVRGSLVKVTDSWPACHEFEPSTTDNPPCRRNTLNMSQTFSRGMVVWIGGCQLSCCSRHLTMVQNYKVRHQKS